MSKLTIVRESKEQVLKKKAGRPKKVVEKFVIETDEHEALYSLIYVAYNSLCGDLDDKDLSDASSIALSRELDIFRKLKRIFQKEIS